MARAHVSLPDELLEEVDRIAGRRRRSQFVEDAIREKLRRAAQDQALANQAGVLRDEDYPQWRTPADVSQWVEQLRAESERRYAQDRP